MTPTGEDQVTPRSSQLMKHPKATAWGAGIMGVAGLLGAMLGPSPLLLPFAPLISVAYAPFAVATSALGMSAGLANLDLGGKAAFVVWCTVLGAAAGRLLGSWLARRRARTNALR